MAKVEVCIKFETEIDPEDYEDNGEIPSLEEAITYFQERLEQEPNSDEVRDFMENEIIKVEVKEVN